MDKFGLKPQVIAKIQQVLSRFNEISSVIIYGSRAKGSYKNGSDIDLTIKTNSDKNNDLLYKVNREIDDLNLIYYFDISLFNQITNQDLIDHINRVGIEFYKTGTGRRDYSRIK